MAIGLSLGKEVHVIYADLRACDGTLSLIAAVPLPRHPLTSAESGLDFRR